MDYAERMRACQHGTSPEHHAGSKVGSRATCAAVGQLGQPAAAAVVGISQHHQKPFPAMCALWQLTVHGVQQATPWAPMAHAYRSVSRHARRCSSNPPQGAGWDHSAEEAFMATQGPLGFWS